MKKFFGSLVVFLLLAAAVLGICLLLDGGQELDLGFAKESYRFGSVDRSQEGYRDDNYFDVSAEYTEALALPKKVRIAFEADVTLRDEELPAGGLNEHGRLLELLVSTNDGLFRPDSSNLEMFIFDNEELVSAGSAPEYDIAADSKVKKSSNFYDVQPGETYHVRVVFERFGSKCFIESRVVRDGEETKVADKEFTAKNGMPDTMYLRLGGTNVTVDELTVTEAVTRRVSSYTAELAWGLAIILWALMLYKIIILLSQAIEGYNGDSLYLGIIMIPTSLAAGALFVTLSQLWSDQLIADVNGFIRDSLSLPFFVNIGLYLRLPMLGTTAFWVTLGVCAALLIASLVITLGQRIELGAGSVILGWLVLTALWCVYSVIALAFIVAMLKELLPLGVLFLFVFGMSGVSAGKEYSGPHAEEVKAYDEKLQERERLVNGVLTGAPFTNEEVRDFGMATGDVDTMLAGQIMKDAHDDAVRKYEQKLDGSSRG